MLDLDLVRHILIAMLLLLPVIMTFALIAEIRNKTDWADKLWKADLVVLLGCILMILVGTIMNYAGG